ncbi:MAG: hypothetical protein K0R05_196 [Anaerocolumna sp.]|jgi:hypothetical protein|nr:hypothetical protein [Anaerocolumna sp.]
MKGRDVLKSESAGVKAINIGIQGRGIKVFIGYAFLILMVLVYCLFLTACQVKQYSSEEFETNGQDTFSILGLLIS